MQSRMGMPQASPGPVGRVARCVCAVLLIALGLGCAPSAHAKDLPDTVLEVTPVGGTTYAETLTIYGIVSSPTVGGPAPTGTITFAYRDPPPTNYNHSVCSVTINTDYPVQSCESGGPIPVGTYHFILIYSGDDNYEGNANGMLATEDYVISKQTPTIALAPPPPVYVGQYAPLKLLIDNATKTEGRFGATIGGDNGDCNIFHPGEICSAGKTRFAGTAVPVYAGFAGDDNHNAVPETAVGQITILPAPTTLVIEPHAPIALGDTAYIVLSLSTILDPDARFFAGKVTLSDGEVSCQFETANLYPPIRGDCPLTPVSAGTRQLTASYSGYNDATSSTATGTLEVVASKVDGACGSDNGAVLAATPTNLCSAGTPSAVSGTGHPWSWTCTGIGGGSDVSCSATAETTTKPVPVLAWPAPAPIVYGTELGAAQLNATATWNGNPVAGIFTYTPAAGTVLNVGPNQGLWATFVPSDTASYATPASPVTTTITVTLTAAQSPASAPALDRAALGLLALLLAVLGTAARRSKGRLRVR